MDHYKWLSEKCGLRPEKYRPLHPLRGSSEKWGKKSTLTWEMWIFMAKSRGYQNENGNL